MCGEIRWAMIKKTFGRLSGKDVVFVCAAKQNQTPNQGMTGRNNLMQEPVQAPVSRTALQEWLEDRYGIFMDVYQGEDTVLRLYNETCFPEINVLCAGEAEKFTDTVEICGMYDKRTREFRFVSSQLSSIINGISKEECCSDSGQSESIYAGICCYAKEAVEQRGYTFEDSTSELYAGLRQAVQTGLSAMVDYAAVLSAGGKRNAVLDARDLALNMLYFWRDSVYLTYEKGYARVEQEYAEKFDQAVRMAEKTGQAPAFSGQKAKDMLGRCYPRTFSYVPAIRAGKSGIIFYAMAAIPA